MTYELWVGRTLYFSTRSKPKAFSLYRRFKFKGQNIDMKLIKDLIVFEEGQAA